MTAKLQQPLEKGVSESLVMGISMDAYLQSGETITAVSASTSSPSGLTISGSTYNASSETFFGNTVTAGRAILFTCSGGTAGVEYTVYFECTTSTSDTKDVKAIIKVTAANGV